MLPYAESVHRLAAEQIEEVERLHEETLPTGEVTGRMQALIKNVVENQRSVLDYTAQAVSDKYGCANKKPYWVRATAPADFPKELQSQLPGILANEPAIAQAFERHQPYQPDHDWVSHLFALTNENKHQRLTPQEGGDELRPQPIRTGGSRIMPPVVVRVRWDFEDPCVPVLETLHRIQEGVEQVADDVCSAAGL